MKYREAIQYLQESDPKLGKLIDEVGECNFAASLPKTNLLSALVWSIIAQQISTIAANKLYQRLMLRYADKKPLQAIDLLQASEDELRSIGISRYKIRYLKNVAQFMLEEGANLVDELEKMDDEIVIQTLIQVKGVGQWTAQMILIFWLQRLDILPSGDLGIRRAIQQLYQYEKMPSPAVVEDIGKQWQPYRTIASWYLWRSLSNSILGIDL
jgi:DNA-3-methyladenine glycosylase II